VIDARDKLTGLIRRAIEDQAGLELVTSRGKPTPRGSYDTTWMFAQDGAATPMTIEAAWYPSSASFTLAGPAVDRTDETFWTDRGLHRGRKNVDSGPLQCHLFVPYADAGRVNLLLGVLPALLPPNHQDTFADTSPRVAAATSYDVVNLSAGRRAVLSHELAQADRALAGDSTDDEHTALHGLAAAVRGLLDGSGHSRTRKSAPGLAAGQEFTGAPGAPPPSDRRRRQAATAPSADTQPRPGRRQ
jgi:hypothetical protein